MLTTVLSVERHRRRADRDGQTEQLPSNAGLPSNSHQQSISFHDPTTSLFILHPHHVYSPGQVLLRLWLYVRSLPGRMRSCPNADQTSSPSRSVSPRLPSLFLRRLPSPDQPFTLEPLPDPTRLSTVSTLTLRRPREEARTRLSSSSRELSPSALHLVLSAYFDLELTWNRS